MHGVEHKCVSCNRDVASLMPVLPGNATVCGCCLVVMINDNGTFRLASDAEAATPDVQRKLQLARWVRRLFPPGDVQ